MSVVAHEGQWASHAERVAQAFGQGNASLAGSAGSLSVPSGRDSDRLRVRGDRLGWCWYLANLQRDFGQQRIEIERLAEQAVRR